MRIKRAGTLYACMYTYLLSENEDMMGGVVYTYVRVL